jgi:redox-sensitive bicupin YhaK (pirin superfamily)
MTSHRRIARVVTVPALSPGFAGPGHLAAQVLSPADFAENDPFIMLADDHLDMGERPVGGPHPHAGFETVTLILDGAIHDRDEGGVIGAGEVQWMTAGRGIIHGEDVTTTGRVRLLQLWLTLPKADRWTAPAFQDIHASEVPVRREPGATVRVYSGASGPARAVTRNHVPVTISETTMAAHAAVMHDLPASYNGFVFVIDGAVSVGEADDATLLQTGQVGWLGRGDGDGQSLVRMLAGADGARVVLYAGEPQGDPIVAHGPFIGDSRQDIARLYEEFRAGEFPRLSELKGSTVP